MATEWFKGTLQGDVGSGKYFLMDGKAIEAMVVERESVVTKDIVCFEGRYRYRTNSFATLREAKEWCENMYVIDSVGGLNND